MIATLQLLRLLLVFWLTKTVASAAPCTFLWDLNEDRFGIRNYVLKLGHKKGVYTLIFSANSGQINQFAIDLNTALTYYVVVTAIDEDGRESQPSAPITIHYSTTKKKWYME